MVADGEFLKVAVLASGNGVRNASELKKGFLHAEEGKIYLLTHIQTINDPEAVGLVPMHGMRCATCVAASDNYERLGLQ